ncbi:protein O-linked-mannose beta-1,2-N-acetylglucosaminyltransferase 1-like isoform X3 [Dreissena polymorpha]|uniref:protein O-linked-mannose beta-1,2-N-acetylglucosaminyltransferase 1-like isoform X3 n=1 Tax=Dreissena polymorpha TaxID=45954 RepID=UPI002264D4D4|nr:protein O-linked-mannose beta-1,2-N-acetylglucosaminyltransferase 1-like isoform X3 [Dreissena polymorpha]
MYMNFTSIKNICSRCVPHVSCHRTRMVYLRKFLSRKHFMKICKALLLSTLVVSLIVNISFVMDTDGVFGSLQLPRGSESKDKNVQQSLHSYHGNPTPSLVRTVKVEVVSSKQLVAVKVDDTSIHTSDGLDIDRGIHIVVLNQVNMNVMAVRVFDTYQKQEDENMINFLADVTPGRILIFAIKDEGTFNLQEKSRSFLADMGSEFAPILHWRDMWAFVCIHKGKRLGEAFKESEDLSVWAEPAYLSVNVTLTTAIDAKCPWPATAENERRRVFCNKYEGYGSICRCDRPDPIHFNVTPLANGGILDVPVTVIASNRPAYLYRMLRRLLVTPGVPVNKISVFIDGYHDEPLAVTRLLNVRGVQHAPLSQKNARISQHYKFSLTETFNTFPDAQHIIILEEDLDVSPDFFLYFQQTMPLLVKDPTLYCVSAWNDQGYEHSCQDERLLYRIETMPGLGWMLKRSLFMDELLPQWPSADKLWDWDMWMRNNGIRKSRECIIPDVSRTYHFGAKGLNVNPHFQESYFSKHKLQSKPDVKLKDVDKITSENYEVLVRDLIKSAKVLDHSKNPCDEHFIPDYNDETFVLYIKMKTPQDYETWKQLARCYKLWDLDVRGFHKSMWRQFLHGKHLVIVGVPASPYSDLKPADVNPIYLQEPKKETPATEKPG